MFCCSYWYLYIYVSVKLREPFIPISKKRVQIKAVFLVMEKSRSMPDYSSYVKGQYAFEDRPRTFSFNGPSNSGDEFGASGNPELKRKKRVASYNMYSMEGKLKSTFRNSFKWIKSKFYDDYCSWIFLLYLQILCARLYSLIAVGCVFGKRDYLYLKFAIAANQSFLAKCLFYL